MLRTQHQGSPFPVKISEFIYSEKRKQGMCLLAKHRAHSKNPMCARLKVGCPQGLPSANLKRQGFTEYQIRASCFFLTTWNTACWKRARQTHAVSFMVCSVPRISNLVFFPLPFVDKKKKKGEFPVSKSALAGEHNPQQIHVLPFCPVLSSAPRGKARPQQDRASP